MLLSRDRDRLVLDTRLVENNGARHDKHALDAEDSKAPEQAADDLIGVAKSSETPVNTTIP
jgi:hypothetical protein